MSRSDSTARIDVVGLGPAGLDLVSPLVLRLISEVEHRFVRTRQHPAAVLLDADPSFDGLYERLDTFAEVYRQIADELIAAARQHGRVLYAVPGSPLVLERTVELLRTLDDPTLQVVCHPSISFLDSAWAALGVDPVEAGATLIDGHRFDTQAAGLPGPLLVAHCHANHVLADIKISADPHPDHPDVTLLHHLGLPDEQVVSVPWFEMDRAIEADHLTSLWIPQVAGGVGRAATHFSAVVERLRAECPWDAEQTHRSLRRYLVEESAEAIDALDSFDEDTGDGAAELVDEFGDLLFQVWLHAQIASETGLFDLVDVLDAVATKLEARHPHVFGDAVAGTAAEARQRWEAAKYAESAAAPAVTSAAEGSAETDGTADAARTAAGRKSSMDGIPSTLPVLMRAMKVRSRAAGAGIDTETAVSDLAAARILMEQLSPLAAAPLDVYNSPEAESLIGDLLIALAGVARHVGADLDRALSEAIDKYSTTVRSAEAE